MKAEMDRHAWCVSNISREARFALRPGRGSRRSRYFRYFHSTQSALQFEFRVRGTFDLDGEVFWASSIGGKER